MGRRGWGQTGTCKESWKWKVNRYSNERLVKQVRFTNKSDCKWRVVVKDLYRRSKGESMDGEAGEWQDLIGS